MDHLAKLRAAATDGGYCAAQAEALGRIDSLARADRYGDRGAADRRLADIVEVLAALDVVRAERTTRT